MILSLRNVSFRISNLNPINFGKKLSFHFHKRNTLPLNPSSESHKLANDNRISSIAPLPADYVSEAATSISFRWCITCTCTYTYIQPGSGPVKPVCRSVPGSWFPVPVPLAPSVQNFQGNPLRSGMRLRSIHHNFTTKKGKACNFFVIII